MANTISKGLAYIITLYIIAYQIHQIIVLVSSLFFSFNYRISLRFFLFGTFKSALNIFKDMKVTTLIANKKVIDLKKM